jgi:hypothetical protein
LNPKLKAWRLQPEKRYAKLNGRREVIDALVLRNQNGIVRRVAKSLSEQAELKSWYRNYNRTTRTEDLVVSKTLKRKIIAIRDKLSKEGFIYREICFGTARNIETGKQEYKRIEVFKMTPWTRRERQHIWFWFKIHMRKSNIGIFAIHKDKLYLYPLK